MSMMRKLADFARSPQGRQLAAQAKKAAKDPEQRRKIEQLRQRLASKRRSS